MTQQEIGAARIGNGNKLHPAVRENGHLYFQCCCRGTQNGSANHTARFYPNQAATCRGR